MISDKEAESKFNIKQLKMLIDQYVQVDKNKVINKVKIEQK